MNFFKKKKKAKQGYSLKKKKKSGESLARRPSGDVLWDTAMKHSAQAFLIPHALSEQSSKNFGSYRSKQNHATQTWSPEGRAHLFQ